MSPTARRSMAGHRSATSLFCATARGPMVQSITSAFWSVSGSEVRLTFLLNRFAYKANEEEKGCLTFEGCTMWRLGATKDEGWYAGQCRYSKPLLPGASST